jgi:uncharacterized protein (DUF2252 family)
VARRPEAATKKLWSAEIERREPKSLDAPSWLWASVVDLITPHESAYLKHCRR